MAQQQLALQMAQQAQQQPLGLGVFAMDEDIMGGNSRGSKATGKKKNDEDDANYTTVMLRNIPNKYTRQMLIDQLHRASFKGDIDYLYLPTDFANRCNVGYCFVNFRDAPARARFVVAFDGVAAQSCLPGFNSYKVCQVTRAKWQGREDNVRRLKSSPELMAQLAAHTEWLPLLMDAEGNQEPFLCDESISAARGPAQPRRQMRKKNQQGMMGYPGMPDMSAWEAAFAMGGGMGGGMAGMMDDGSGMGGMGAMMPGRGRGGGDRGKRRGRGGGPAYPDMMGAAGSYSGAPAMMSVPVMTEQGLQYIPYDAYEGGYFLAYSPMSPDVYGMMPSYGGGYPGAGGAWDWQGGFPQDAYGGAAGVWPGAAGRPAKGAGRGRRRGGAAAAAAEGGDDDEE